MKIIVISGGGTAGHINPALSIARYMRDAGWQVHFIGNKNSLEERLINKAGYPFHKINVMKLYRRFTFAYIKFPFLLCFSIIRSIIIFKKLKPALYLGTGGFVSGPAGLAAHLMKIPIYLQEQNSYPGMTTRYLAKWSQLIFLGNRKAADHLPGSNTQYTGNPINPVLLQSPNPIDQTSLKLDPAKKKVFLLGGSQGSLKLNSVLEEIVDDLLDNDLQLIWQTGSYSYQKFHDKFGNREGIYLFSYTDNIAALYAISDLLIARAGAITLTELEYLKKPAILVPLPTAAANHQLYNAQESAEKGEAEIIEQKNLTPVLLLKKVILMMENISDYEMKFSDSRHQHSAKDIAGALTDLVGN